MIKRIILLIFISFQWSYVYAQWNFKNTIDENTFFRGAEENKEVKFGFSFADDDWVWYVEGIEINHDLQIFFDDKLLRSNVFKTTSSDERYQVDDLEGNSDFLLKFYAATKMKVNILDPTNSMSFTFDLSDSGPAIEKTTSMEMFDFLDAVEKKGKSNKIVEEIYKVVEQMPAFGDCTESDFMISQCTREALEKYVADNLIYPSEARKQGVEGKVYIRFVVEKDGSISDAVIVRDIGAGCGEAALALVNAMNSPKQQWRPGMSYNVAVRVLYTMPVLFKL